MFVCVCICSIIQVEQYDERKFYSVAASKSNLIHYSI